MSAIQPCTAAEAAAAWWAEQVGAPVYRMVDDQSPREDHETAGMVGALQTLISDRYPVSREAGEKFTRLLAKRIDKTLKRCDWVSLGVDYGPELDLAEPAEAAGIHRSRFPWKTHMHIRRDYVTASLGYRARDVLVWQSPEWNRPGCGNHRYTEDYQATDDLCTKPRFHHEDCGDWRQDTDRCEGCGLTYAGHYGQDGKRQRREAGDFHSYKPAVTQ